MLLAIDIGNTNSLFALIEGEQILHEFRMRTDANRTADEYFVWLSALCHANGLACEFENVILSSTVPAAIYNIRVLSHKYFSGEPLIVGSKNCPIDIEVRLDQGTRAGPDRLVNAMAGFKEYGPNLIIVDIGTATTFDIVANDGAYEGGIIAPGVNLSVKALSDAAAALPHVDVARPNHVVGKNTKDAMQSGIFWGYSAMVEGLCARIAEERSVDMNIILTGGLSHLFAHGIKKYHALDGDITIKGLILIANKIKEN